MNRYTRWGFALVLLPLAACASNPPPAPVMAPAGPPPLAASDSTFIQDATQGGLAEIQEAQLAQKMSHNPRIKAYASRMITDHTQANDQLKPIAMAKGATLPTTPSDTQMQEFTALQAEKGHKFDHDYIADQIAGHTTMLQMFQTEAQSSADPDLKKYAADTTPVVQSHLDLANSIAKGPMHKGMMHHHHHHTAA